MYISLKYRFLYYRIPKTASTSMSIALKPYLTKLNTFSWKNRDVHCTPSESLVTLSKLDIPINNDFKMLMVIRHPYTRIMSLYNYAQDVLLERKIDNFDYFLDLLEAKNNNDSHAKSLLSSKRFDDQMLWTHDPNAFNLNIIKYEELDTNTISNCLGIPSLILPEENRNSIPADQCVLHSYQKEKIYSIYQNEFDAYCYQK